MNPTYYDLDKKWKPLGVTIRIVLYFIHGIIFKKLRKIVLVSWSEKSSESLPLFGYFLLNKQIEHVT